MIIGTYSYLDHCVFSFLSIKLCFQYNILQQIKKEDCILILVTCINYEYIFIQLILSFPKTHFLKLLCMADKDRQTDRQTDRQNMRHAIRIAVFIQYHDIHCIHVILVFDRTEWVVQSYIN